MFNYIQGGRHEIVEKDRYEDKEELTDHQKKIEEAKKRLQWRTPYSEQPTFWNSKFSLFTSDKTDLASADIIDFLQTKFDFSWKGMKERRERKRVKMAGLMQQFIPERHAILGNDLAAAHFICFRQGSVKYVGGILISSLRLHFVILFSDSPTPTNGSAAINKRWNLIFPTSTMRRTNWKRFVATTWNCTTKDWRTFAD